MWPLTDRPCHKLRVTYSLDGADLKTGPTGELVDTQPWDNLLCKEINKIKCASVVWEPITLQSPTVTIRLPSKIT